MSEKVNKIQSNNYVDGNNTALVKAGTNITVTTSAGGYTVNSNSPVTFTTTTNGSGTITINLTSFAFANAPIVQLTAQNSNTAQYLGANFTGLTTTSITINTFISQNTAVLIGGNIIPFTTAPNAVVHVTLTRV